MSRWLTAFLTMLVLCLTLSGCSGAGQAYTDYVQAVMDCTYYGDTAQYMAFTGCAEADAQKVHADEVAYVTSLLYYKATVKEEYLDEETAAGYRKLAEELLSRVKFRIEPAMRSGSGYHVTIAAAPLEYWELPAEKLQKIYAKNFAKRFYQAPPDSEELARAEADWGKRALTALTNAAENADYQDARSAIVEITVDAQGHYSISEQNWQMVDELLLGLTEAE